MKLKYKIITLIILVLYGILALSNNVHAKTPNGILMENGWTDPIKFSLLTTSSTKLEDHYNDGQMVLSKSKTESKDIKRPSNMVLQGLKGKQPKIKAVKNGLGPDKDDNGPVIRVTRGVICEQHWNKSIGPRGELRINSFHTIEDFKYNRYVREGGKVNTNKTEAEKRKIARQMAYIWTYMERI